MFEYNISLSFQGPIILQWMMGSQWIWSLLTEWQSYCLEDISMKSWLLKQFLKEFLIANNFWQGSFKDFRFSLLEDLDQMFLKCVSPFSWCLLKEIKQHRIHYKNLWLEITADVDTFHKCVGCRVTFIFDLLSRYRLYFCDRHFCYEK